MSKDTQKSVDPQDIKKLLFHAVITGDMDKLKQIIAVHGIAPSDEITDRHGKTLLHHAALNNRREIFDYLKSEYNLKPYKLDNNGLTPLHEAAFGGHIEMFEHLVVTYDLNPCTYDNYHRTPLRCAAYNGQIPMIDCLIAYGLDPDEPDSHGRTPTHYAAAMEQRAMVDHLAVVIMRRDPTATHPCKRAFELGKTILHDLAFNGKIGMLDYMVAKYHLDVNKADNNCTTPMHEAAHAGQLEMIRHLISKHRADFNKPNKNGLTSLDYAVNNGKEETAMLIKEAMGTKGFANRHGISGLYNPNKSSLPFIR